MKLLYHFDQTWNSKRKFNFKAVAAETLSHAASSAPVTVSVQILLDTQIYFGRNTKFKTLQQHNPYLPVPEMILALTEKRKVFI